MATREGSENPFLCINGILDLGYGEDNLIIASIQIGSKYSGVFSYQDICNFDYDKIQEILELVKDKK